LIPFSLKSFTNPTPKNGAVGCSIQKDVP